MMTLKECELKTALSALEKYYGITEEFLPESLRRGIPGSIKLTWGEELRRSFFTLVPGADKHRQLFVNLVVLTNCVLESARLQGALYTQELFDKLRKRDYLRLYEIVLHTRDEEEITIRNKSRSIRLNNYSNWFVNELLMPFLQLKNVGVKTLAEIEDPKPTKKGRRASDPRVSIMLWGTYQMITDVLEFASPMPNNLCSFLILLLQHQKVLAVTPIIDTFWIRAQLRYIRSRPEKPRFPIED